MKTKDDIVRSAARKAGTTQKVAEAVVNSMLESIADVVAQGDSVQFRNFGTFEPKKLAGRLTYNPTTGAMCAVTERTTITFKVSPVLRLKVDPNNLTARMRRVKGD